MPTKLGASVTHEVKLSHYHRPLTIPQTSILNQRT